MRTSLAAVFAAFATVAVAALPAAAQSSATGDAARGEYVFNAAGCLTCHTDTAGKGAPLAGGRALKTPFGVFRTPNITPDPAHGIGAWSEADFFRAMREGKAPDGSPYYPAFPYTAYTKMTDGDLRDLWAYLRARPAVAKPDMPHELSFPYNIRLGVVAWQWLNFTPGSLPAASGQDAAWMRGRYLTEALGHCAECHTPRGALGGLVKDRWMGGSPDGAEGEAVPNITPHPQAGIGEWSAEDIAWALKTGSKPDGDSMGSLMAEVVENGTSKLTDADLMAMAAYLQSLPPLAKAP